jgi:hypothetical protein
VGWLLLDADRRVVAGVVLAAFFAVFVVLGALDPVGLRNAVETSDPVETLFQALVTAIVTGVTLVVTINQLVLSQELGAVGDQRDRMDGAMAFRRDVEDLLDEPVAPAEPASFLRAVVDESRSRAERLRESIPEDADDRLGERVDGYVDSLGAEATATSDGLADAEFGTFAVLRPALDYDYSRRLHEARRLKAEHEDALGAAGRDVVDDVIEALELFGPAREHIKTLYFQWELIDLSRTVLYASVPALAVTVATILYAADPATFAGVTLGVADLVWVVSAATTVALVPFVVLLSYVLRIATVAKRTLAIGPFVLRETRGDRAGDRDGRR